MEEWKWLIKELINSGHKIWALKLIRQSEGVGLNEAKFILDNWFVIEEYLSIVDIDQ